MDRAFPLRISEAVHYNRDHWHQIQNHSSRTRTVLPIERATTPEASNHARKNTSMTIKTNRARGVRLLSAILTIVSAVAIEQVASAQNSIEVRAISPAAGLDDFYRLDVVQSVYLRVAEEDMRRMLSALPERIYVPASFRWRDVTVNKVAIRFKGNSSSAPSQRHKRSFLIRFSEYENDQRFLGLRRVSFDNGIQFGSVFSEPIITEILRHQGIKTHRCNYARLFLNDKYYGVYVNVERIDESFIEHHLPDANGMLFKVDEGGPGGNLQFLGDNPASYERAFEAETKSAKKGRDQLVEFIKMINQSPANDFAANLDSKMEVDDFLRTTAVMLFSGAFDQLTGWNPHNYYLYCDEKGDRWRYLPWDLDVGFCETAFGRVHVLADWNAAWPVVGQTPNPLMERIVSDPALLERYRQTARTILDEYFQPERLCTVIDARYALIKEDLLADPFPHQRVTNPSDQSYEDIVASMKEFVRKRYAAALQQLENPGQRPQIERRPDGPPPHLVEKIQRLHRRVQEMQRNGDDVLPIHQLMQHVGPLLQQGRANDAERLVVAALKLAGESPAKGKQESPRDERESRPTSNSGG